MPSRAFSSFNMRSAWAPICSGRFSSPALAAANSCIVGHRRPEEIRQPRGDLVGAELDQVAVLDGLAVQFPAVEELGRLQDGQQQVVHRLAVGGGDRGGPQLAEQPHVPARLGRGQRPAEGAQPELLHELGDAVLLGPGGRSGTAVRQQLGQVGGGGGRQLGRDVQQLPAVDRGHDGRAAAEPAVDHLIGREPAAIGLGQGHPQQVAQGVLVLQQGQPAERIGPGRVDHPVGTWHAGGRGRVPAAATPGRGRVAAAGATTRTAAVTPGRGLRGARAIAAPDLPCTPKRQQRQRRHGQPRSSSAWNH